MEAVAEKYKMTEVGLIPSDWEVKTLGDIALIKRGKFTPRPRNNPIYYGGNIPFVQTGDVTKSNGKIVHYTQTLNEEGLAVSSLFKKGTILMTIAANIGYTGILQIDMACPDSLVAIDGLGKTDNDFLNFYFSFKREKLEELATTGAQMNLNIERLSPFKIPLPPTITEQTLIATALSDTDALISSFEKLIAKKRNIKQGAMQKLLQPKEGWEVKPFKDLCWFQEGPGLRNWQFTTRGIKVINVTNLENGILNLDRTERHISLEEFHKMYEHFEIDEKDIVVASSGNSYGKVAVVRKQDLPLVMNTSVIRFKPFKELDYNFLLTYLKSNQFKNQIDLLITGGAQPNFGPVHLNKISINLPPTKEEQTRIASILLDMDNEMLALETKLEKYKNVKLGMMQNLLTGKIRLV